ncbi:MAG: YitT family protein [Acidobacteriota bacterium]
MTDFFRKVVRIILIIVGILAAGLGLRGFLIPNHFIDGGVTGTSMFVSELSGIRLSILILLINTPFVIIGWRQIGKMFSIRSAIAIVGLAITVFVVPYPEITHDKLLAAVFGGFFLGAGIGLAIRGGAVLDGTEVLALLVSRKTGLTVGDFIFAFNVVLFSVAAFFLGIEPALYSMLTYFSASKTIDFLIHGIEEYSGVIIVSPKSQEIRQAIVDILERGVTVFAGSGGKHQYASEILYCVVTRYEIPKIKDTVKAIDSNAFMTIHNISDTSGGIIRSPLSPVLQPVDLHEEMENSKAQKIDISISPDRIKDED